MAKYRKADNCGPVPHPDRSGKFLKEGEVAEGDAWEPYVALGYVVRVDSPVVEQVKTVAVAEAKLEVAPVAPTPKADSLKEEVQGVPDANQVNDGNGAEEVDSSAAGASGDEGSSGRPSGRRRRQ